MKCFFCSKEIGIQELQQPTTSLCGTKTYPAHYGCGRDKKKYFAVKNSFGDSCIWEDRQSAEDHIESENENIDAEEMGCEEYRIEEVEMTPREFQELGEFEGF